MILHVDMDAFYASVEVRDDPTLQGHPVVVGGNPTGRGVVAAANYEARKFGVHSAMPMSKAIQLCPHLKIVRGRHGHYSSISREMCEIFGRFTPVIERIALDEAFLDVAGVEHLFGSSESIGRQIKDAIFAELGLVASVGIASNKSLAKLASALSKPNGLLSIPDESLLDVLAPLSVSKIWGVGAKAASKLSKFGIKKFADLHRLTEVQACQLLGKCGSHVWRMAHGIDDRLVISERESKSISHESTFGEDVYDLPCLRAWTNELGEAVSRRLRIAGKECRGVQVKIRYGDFHALSRRHSLDSWTDSTDEVCQLACDLLEDGIDQRLLLRSGVRLVGLGVFSLRSKGESQLELFTESGSQARQSRLDTTKDMLRTKFGEQVVRRGSSLEHQIKLNRKPRSGEGSS